jgi:hypothetical protein
VPVAQASSPFLDATPVRTSLGGVLFLINLMLYLDLPGGAGAEPDLETALGCWGTLAALGAGLLDTLPEARRSWPRWQRDAMWPKLAHLAGRDERQRLGESMRRQSSFELPPAWREADSSQPELWATNSRRIRRWSSSGYLVEERRTTPTDSSGPPELQRPYNDAPLYHLSTAASRRLAPGLRYWLARVLPYLRLRLAGAMGADAAETDGALRELLLREGRLYVSSAHVDLVLRLGDVSVAARMAGLDRDPGWQPRFGRVIKFHFE